MDKIKIISKIALFFAVASFVFAAISAVSTYFLIQISYSGGAPVEYVALNVVSIMLPYLAIGVFSLVVAVMSKALEEEEPEKEASPQVVPTEANA